LFSPLVQPYSARPVGGASPFSHWRMFPKPATEHRTPLEAQPAYAGRHYGLILLQRYDLHFIDSTQFLNQCFAERFLDTKTMSRSIGFLLTTILPILSPARAIPRLHSFSTLGATVLKNLPPRPKPPPDSEIEESYLKGSGPGGQKIVRIDTQNII
jgi:hypothetical protein